MLGADLIIFDVANHAETARLKPGRCSIYGGLGKVAWSLNGRYAYGLNGCGGTPDLDDSRIVWFRP